MALVVTARDATCAGLLIRRRFVRLWAELALCRCARCPEQPWEWGWNGCNRRNDMHGRYSGWDLGKCSAISKDVQHYRRMLF